MLGDIMVFVVVLAIVGSYMTIVHSFLRSAEEPGDFANETANTPVPKKRANRSSGRLTPASVGH